MSLYLHFVFYFIMIVGCHNKIKNREHVYNFDTEIKQSIILLYCLLNNELVNQKILKFKYG